MSPQRGQNDNRPSSDVDSKTKLPRKHISPYVEEEVNTNALPSAPTENPYDYERSILMNDTIDREQSQTSAKQAAEEVAAKRPTENAEAKKVAEDIPTDVQSIPASPSLPEEKVEPIRFKDAIGRKFKYPFHMCNTWKGIESLIKETFLHVDVIGPQVAKGHYDLVGPNEEIVLPQVWDTVVEPGWTVTMHMWPLPEPSLNEKKHSSGDAGKIIVPRNRKNIHPLSKFPDSSAATWGEPESFATPVLTTRETPQHRHLLENEVISTSPCQRCRKFDKRCNRQRPCQSCAEVGIDIQGCIIDDESGSVANELSENAQYDDDFLERSPSSTPSPIISEDDLDMLMDRNQNFEAAIEAQANLKRRKKRPKKRKNSN